MLASPHWATKTGSAPANDSPPRSRLPAKLLNPLRPRSMEHGAPNRIFRMKRPHPKRNCAVTLAGIVVIAIAGGCHNQQTALSNPFMSPDRVPPPSTRAVAPGTAQPYYPGDPIPAPHAAVASPAPPVASAPAATPAPSPASNAVTPTANPNGALAFSNERSVSVPADDSSLRFSLPEPPPATTVATSPQPAVGPATQSAAPPPQMVAQNAPAVVPASFSSPDPNRTPTTSTPDPSPNGPWRAPQVPAAALVTNGANPWITPMSPVAVAGPPPVVSPVGPSVPVTLRAVSSPAVDTTVSEPPRIRFPTYDSTAAGAPVQQAAFVAPPGSIQPQIVTIAPVPTAGTVPGLGPSTMPSVSIASQPQPSAVVSPDGFRPRSTMR